MPDQTAAPDALGALAASLLSTTERRYVESLNAVLAARSDSPDIDRWRGHAEAHRATCVSLREAAQLPAVEYGSRAWRTANGVYTEREVAEMHR